VHTYVEDKTSLVLAWARIDGHDGHMTVTANEESMVEGVSRDTRYGAWEPLEDDGRTYAATYSADGFSLDM
jgi:hypothetical protein